jgi:hypothetical protein
MPKKIKITESQLKQTMSNLLIEELDKVCEKYIKDLKNKKDSDDNEN